MMRRAILIRLTAAILWTVAGDAAIVPMTPVTWSVRSAGYDETGITLNAAGEYAGTVGHLYLPAQTGSATCSAAGGCVIYWNVATVTAFADPGTTLRIGLQDVTVATGMGDGTFDVHADLVGGTDALASNTLVATPMESGTTTLAHNALVVVIIETETRAGADGILIPRLGLAPTQRGFPYLVFNVGTPSIAVAPMLALIEFDDGSAGWIAGAPLRYNVAAGSPTTIGSTTIAFNNTDTPDEYMGIVRVAAPIAICGLGTMIGAVGTADTFELILYSDPLGTPVAARTWAPDPDGLATTALHTPSMAPFTLAAGTDYGIALRPTAASDIEWSYFDLTSGFDLLKAAQPFSAITMAARSNQTGPFVETQSYHLPDIAIEVCGLDDGAGGGSGETSHVFVQ